MKSAIVLIVFLLWKVASSTAYVYFDDNNKDVIDGMQLIKGEYYRKAWSAGDGTYSRSFTMLISNYLKYPLVQPRAWPWYGRVTVGPEDIRPCYMEGTAGRKTGYTATGTSGIMSWRIRELNTTILVFWDVPYSWHLCNHIALGIYTDLKENEPKESEKYQYFDDLYFGPDDGVCTAHTNGSLPKTCDWMECCGPIRDACTTNNGIRVCGHMYGFPDPEIRIQVGPLEVNDFASEGQCSS